MCGPNRHGGFRAWPHAERGSGRCFDPNFMAWFWGGPPGQGRQRRHFRGGRMFDQGDLKYVILQLLAEKPRHGYEIIKELEDRSGGAYSPSPGTVYPTLTMLEEMGYATATQEEGGGKRIYEITQAGRDYLGENRSTVDDIFERIADIGASFFGGGMMEVNHAFKDLGRATYTTAPRYARDTERLEKIREVLRRAAREIEEIGKQR
jgi:DNA-binding PadR family transcriptional regulator